MDLGLEASFTKFPASIKLGGSSYFLVRNRKGYQLLSTICPHSWGEIVEWGSCFMCPNHGWRFDINDGECVNGPNARMDSAPVTVREGHLFVDGPLP
jgi:nitrite reductase/ring-hydroxylating ferredoxin subunit